MIAACSSGGDEPEVKNSAPTTPGLTPARR
jgi:hypothetical protein